MVKLFSVLSWNVKHFKLKKKDTKSILKHINKFKPDIFAIYEVTGKHVYDFMMDNFSNYDFHITEGRQSQEILVGTNKKLHTFTSQRTEFNRTNTYLRPGTLTTVKINNNDYSLLFLHTKSYTTPVGFGTRDDQFKKALDLKKSLDKKAGGHGKANFVIMGDLNTMGMDYLFGKDVQAKYELKKLAKHADNRGMQFLQKNYDYTWTNGRKMFGNLDHVLASNHLKFTSFSNDSQVKVSGWKEFLNHPDEPKNSKFTNFVKKISDHNALYFEVQK